MGCSRRWLHERAGRRPGSGHDPPAMQAVADADHRGQCTQLAEQAVRERRTHLGYLEALLQAELEEREQRLIERRIREARPPRMKTLEEFEFARNPKVSPQQIHELAKGDYIAKAEPIIFIGDSGTGKTHLLTGLAVAACRQKRRVRFATAAALINE